MIHSTLLKIQSGSSTTNMIKKGQILQGDKSRPWQLLCSGISTSGDEGLCKHDRKEYWNTFKAETIAGRSFRGFRDFTPFSRKFMPGKKFNEKFAKVIFAK